MMPPQQRLSVPSRTLDANQTYLDLMAQRLGLTISRHILWMRAQRFQRDADSGDGLAISDSQVDQVVRDSGGAAREEFHQQDPRAAQLGRHILDLEVELVAHAKVLAEAGGLPAFEILSNAFGLTRLERDIVFLALASEIDPRFDRLFAHVQEETARRCPTPYLASVLFGGQLEITRAFRPGGVLRRYGIIELEPASGGRLVTYPFRLEERIVAYLLGSSDFEDRPGFLLPIPVLPLVPSHRGFVDRVERWIRSCSDRPAPVVNLLGRVDAGKRAIARALCERLDKKLVALDLRAMSQALDGSEKSLALLNREARLFGLACYVTQEDAASSEAAATAFAYLLRGFEGLLFVEGQERVHGPRTILPVRIPDLNTAEQRLLWRRLLGEIRPECNPILDAVTQQFDFGPDAIAEVAATALTRAQLRGRTADGWTKEDLWESCREYTRRSLDGLAERIIPCYDWDDIVLPNDVLQQLKELAAQVAHRTKVYDDWGFRAHLNRGRGISALFSGPSGTGKTMAAEVIANALALDLYQVDLASVMSKYIGETEKNLKRIFEASERSGSILFFDEADALFARRTELKDSHDHYRNVEVNYLLQQVEDFHGLAVLATNRKSDLDLALMRRLRFVIDFPFPDLQARRRVWEKAFPPEAALDGVDIDALARLEVCGGNIRTIAVNAAFLAAQGDGPIRMSHIMRAAKREYQKIDKLMTETEFGRYFPREDS